MVHSKQITVKYYFKWQIFFCLISPTCDLPCHLCLEYLCVSHKIKHSSLKALSSWTFVFETKFSLKRRMFVDWSGNAGGNHREYWSSPSAFCGKVSLKYGGFTAFLRAYRFWIHLGSSFIRAWKWGTCCPFSSNAPPSVWWSAPGIDFSCSLFHKFLWKLRLRLEPKAGIKRWLSGGKIWA